jgi:type VI secretion system secreted protein VgrG
MTNPLLQDERTGKLTTPLGDNVLALARLNADEGLHELFEFRIEAVSEQANIDFNAALGLGSTVKLTSHAGAERCFNGVMTEARWAGAQGDLYFYQIVLRPWLWFLTRTSDCRIFPNMSVTDIIKQVFTDRGFSDFRDATNSSPPTLEYCVQYRETDFNFVCRLMEEYGIYYFFEHSDGKHTLVLADGKSSHQPAPNLASVPFIPIAQGGRQEDQYVENWSRDRRAQSGKFVLNDYDYNKPPKNLLADSEKPSGYSHDSMEMYDYPGDYDDRGEGSTLAKIKVEAAQSLDNRRASMGAAPSLFPGALVTLQRMPIAAENQEYLVTHCSHVLDAQSYRAGVAAGGRGYSGNYELTPSDCQFRAPLVTRRPEIPGVQSALVVGKDGEEIDVDKLGRILVQFYWDRKKKPSRRVRVAQFWAGNTRGALFTPRIGDEVLVQYEEGDPDRPIVVGSVYNGTNTVPATLPDNKTHSGILTKSSKNSSGYHMLLFDDTQGSERVKLRSQKDLMFKALNNEQRVILANQVEQVGGDETITVGDMTIQATNIGGNFTLNALQTATINVGPAGMPLTQLVMDTQSITLNVGPQGLLAQIVMNATGVTISGTPLSQLMVQPQGISTMTPMITFTAIAEVTFVTPMVTIPIVTIGAGTSSGLPII